MEGRDSPTNARVALSRAAVPAAVATVPGSTGDGLSRLPDHLLVCILLKLRTKQAVETSALSRQWRGVWAQLPVLKFDGVDSSVPARALAAYRAHGEGDIRRLTVSPNQANAQDTTAWLPLAAPILSGRLFLDNSRTVSPETLHLFLEHDDQEAVLESGASVELPCFKKATEIFLDLGFLGLALPPAGVFGALRVMWLEHFWFRAQLSIGDTMFPSLQQLTIRRVRGLVALTLNSKSLLYIHLSALLEFQRLHVLAPGLKKFEVNRCFDVPGPVAASIAAEGLEVFRWEVPCVPDPVCLREMPHLCLLAAPPLSTLWSEDICAEFLSCFPAVDHLELRISLDLLIYGSLLLMEDITIPKVNVLWLYLETNDHVFEGRVLQLLTNCAGIKELNLSFQVPNEMQYLCLPGCLCHNEPKIWGPKVVPIRALKKVGIVNFYGDPREVHLVEQIVLRAPELETLRITSKAKDHSLDSIGRACPVGCRFEIVQGIEAKRNRRYDF